MVANVRPAAVDADQNGILDTVYIGTTAGFMYKIDISAAADVDAVTGRLRRSKAVCLPRVRPK